MLSTVRNALRVALGVKGPARVLGANDSLFDFNILPVDRVKVLTDSVAHGYSTASFDIEQHPEHGAVGVFHGQLVAKRSTGRGYAGFRLVIDPAGVDASQFKGLAMLVLQDSHDYIFNMQVVDRTFSNDIYQGFLPKQLAAGQWAHIYLPFDRFLLTGGGLEREMQHTIPTNGIETFGATVVGDTGDFSLKIAWVKPSNGLPGGQGQASRWGSLFAEPK